LIEEVARLHGYDRIPSRAPRIPQKMLAASEGRRDVGRIKSLLADRGYLEAICYSFVDQQWKAISRPTAIPSACETRSHPR
jgi:phenylalanyl-tRNA synthetase beta chain